MKKIIYYRYFKMGYFALVCCLLLFSCDKIENTTYEEVKDTIAEDNAEGDTDQPEQEVTKTLAELVSENEELTLVNAAFLKADLEPVLDSDGPLTLFAPTNAAVAGLFNLLGPEFNSFEDFETLLELEILNRILSYHLVEGALDSNNLTERALPTLYENNSIEIVPSAGSFLIGDASEVDANLLAVDKKAVNGVLHVIDKILVPQDVIAFLGTPNLSNTSDKTIKELIIETEDFSFLREALELTGLLDTLGEDGPFTVFVPSNATLFDLLELLGGEFTSLEDFTGEEEIGLLRDILLYHVLGEKVVSGDLILGSVDTLSGSNTLEVVTENGTFALVDALFLEANFVTTDIAAQNGIIHVIDRVLIPESVTTLVENRVALAFERAMIDTGDLNTALEFFRAVRNRMELEALAKKEFTFFFPSDRAFIDLFNEIGYDRIQRFNNEEEGLELLKIILSYHCVENVALKTVDFTNELTLHTFQGEKLSVKVDQGVYILDKTDTPAKVTIGDQSILNGYIHVVDKVLLPQEVIDKL